MADELDPVEQRFRADMTQYLDEIQRGVDDARQFATANLEASRAVDDMRDHAAEAGGATADLRDHTETAKEALNGLRDSAFEAGAALGHLRDEALTASGAEKKLADDSSSLGSKLRDAAGKAKGFGPAWLGPVLALAPVATSLLGVTAGAAIGLGGAFFTAGAATAAFGLVAKSVLSQASTAATAVRTAQSNYNIAIANGTKQAAAYKAEQIAIAKAYAGMSPAQIKLSKELGGISDQWRKFKAEVTPMIAGSLQPWLQGVTQGVGLLRSVLTPMAPVVHALGVEFDTLMGSSTMKSFMAWIGTTGSAVTGSLGNAVMDLLTGLTFLLPQFTPLMTGAASAISRWGDAFARWSSSQKAANEIQSFLAWFHTNGPLVTGLLKNAGGALKALAPGLGPATAAELNVISGFFGLIAKLPPDVAKPLLEVAGVLLTLNKLGVIDAGLKLTFPKAGAGKSALAASLGMKLLGGALIVPATVMMIGSIIPKDASRQAAADFKKQPGIVVKVSDFLHTEGMGAWVDQYFSHPIRAWAETSLPHFLAVARHDIASTFDTIRHSVASAWDTTWNNTVARVQRGVGDAVRWVHTLPGRVLGALGNLGSLLLNAGRSLIDGLINGIKSAVPGLSSVLHWVTSLIPSWKGPPAEDLRLLHENGRLIMQGFMNGITSKKSELAALLAEMTGSIPGAAAHGLTGAAGGGGSLSSVHVTVPVTLGAGAAGYNDPRFLQYLQGVVQEAVLRYTQVNPSNGLRLAGKIS